MDVRVTRDMMDLLVPEHLYHRVLTADTTDTDEARAMHAHATLWGDLYQRIGQPIEEHTRPSSYGVTTRIPCILQGLAIPTRRCEPSPRAWHSIHTRGSFV